MAKKNDSAAGCLVLIIGGIGAFLWYSGMFWIAVGVVVFMSVLLFIAARPKHCQICGNQIRKDSYRWEIEGKEKIVCPKCNQAIERKKSKVAVSSLLGSI